MGNSNSGTILSPQKSFIIVEEITPKPIQVIGIPFTPISLDHSQLWRRVYQLGKEEKILFLGEPLKKQVGIKEYIVELLLEGKQITTKATGNQSWFLAYSQCMNIITAPGNNKLEFTTGLKLGSDPIPNINLYKNKRIEFKSSAGLSNPIAAAFYDGKSLKAINPANKAAIMESLK